MTKPLKSRKQIHLKEFDYSESAHVFFITICTENKLSCFSNPEIAVIIEGELEFRRSASKEIRLYCYCIMPDHLHILISLSESYKKSLQNWVAAFKRYTSRISSLMYEIKPLWQKNFYDHVVRKEESLLKISEYIVNNPVRKGLATEWEQYPFSKIIDPLPM